MSIIWLVLMAIQMFSDFIICTPISPKGLTPGDFNDLVQKAHLKRKLEMAINRSIVPHPPSKPTNDASPPHQKHRELPVASPPKEVPSSKLSLLAEALDSHRPDTVTFTFGPRLRATISDHLKKAVLIVRLRPVKNNRRHGKANIKIAAESEIAEKIRNVTSEKAIEKTLLLRIRQTQSQDEDDRDLKGDGDNEIRRASNKLLQKSGNQGQNKNMRDLKAADVKVIINIIDSVTGKKRRLTATKVDVKEPSDVKVTITKEVNDALHSPNHTLTLQVMCKRCKRRVHLEKLFKTSKQKNKWNGPRLRRLNPNRPYLVITTNDNSATDNDIARDARSKRSAPNSCPQGEHLQQFLLLGGKLETCCSERHYITFEQLGLDKIIVFPKGFSTVRCLGSCGYSGQSSVHSTGEPQTLEQELHRRSNKERLVGGASNNERIVAGASNNERLVGGASDNERIVAGASNNERIVAGASNNEKIVAGASPGVVGNQRHCVSIQKSSLDLFYLNENNTIIPIRLDNFIDEACGCPS